MSSSTTPLTTTPLTTTPYGHWSSATVRIALIGDSTLDNCLWVGQGEPSVAEILAGMCFEEAPKEEDSKAPKQGQATTPTLETVLLSESNVSSRPNLASTTSTTHRPRMQLATPASTTQKWADISVMNLAADGFNTAGTLFGSEVVLSNNPRNALNDPVPFDSDGVFRPLECLKRLNPKPTHIVLSVGGNLHSLLSETIRNSHKMTPFIPASRCISVL
jgi:hypothetical protein